jgi:hypothetical protein
MNFITKKRNQEILSAFKKDEALILEYLDVLKKENPHFDEQMIQNIDSIKQYIQNLNVYLSGLENGLKKAR